LNKKHPVVSVLIRIPAIFITVMSFYLSSQPQIYMPPGIVLWDKLLHFVCFAGLTGSWTFWFPLETWKKHTLRNILFCIVGVAVYGALDEWHQSFTPGREVSVYDWFADVLGAVLGSVTGCVLMRLMMKYRERHE
jgi:VanZ family protein